MNMSFSDADFVNEFFEVVVSSLSPDVIKFLPVETKIAILQAMNASFEELDDGGIVATYLFMTITMNADSSVKLEFNVNELMKYQSR